MKFSKILAATSALAFVAASAIAQTYDVTGNSTMRVARGNITPTTVVTDRTVQDTTADLWAYYRCGTAVSITFLQKLTDATVLNSQAVACDTTPRAVSFTAPVPFQVIAASPTTTISATAGVSITLIETKK